jgi:hypothetical protein
MFLTPVTKCPYHAGSLSRDVAYKKTNPQLSKPVNLITDRNNVGIKEPESIDSLDENATSSVTPI